MTPRLKQILDDEYERWRVVNGEIIALAKGYTNPRLHMNCDESGYDNAF